MSARALRVGVVLGGNLVEERVFADANPITIGQSLRCRLSVPADGVPHEHTLFLRDQGQLMLALGSGMTGRLAQGGHLQTELRGTLRIERGARGKLQIGEATILFQEVAAPARSPRPQLPASVRGTFADRIDRRLAIIVGGSILMHVAIASWAWMTDVEEPATATAQVARQFRQDTYTIAIPDEPAPAVSEPGAATPVAPTQTPAPIAPRIQIKATPKPQPALPTVDDATRFAQILTGVDETPGGRTGMSNRLPGAELGTQINDIRDNDRAVGNDDGGFRRGPREGIGDRNNQIVDGISNIAQEQKRDEKPPGRIDVRPGPPQGPDPVPFPEQILAKIRREYMPGLMRCYQRGLLDDASLSGKVAVTFTLLENGKVADPTAKGVSDGVDACIAAQMATWRFPIQKDKDGDPVERDYGLSLALVRSN